MEKKKQISIEEALQSQILILDGAMGTMIQNCHLTESDFRFDNYTNTSNELKNYPDLLNLNKAELITQIHTDYLGAGANILKTNTFNANAVSLANINASHLAYKLNFTGAQIAKNAILEFAKTNPNSPQPLFVAGCMGPSDKTVSPSKYFTSIDFNTLKNAYYTQAKGLMEGGADILLLETILDIGNAKAALLAMHDLFEEKGEKLPIMCSLSLTEDGKCYSGESLENCIADLSDFPLLSLGLNCSFGIKAMHLYLEQISTHSTFYLSAHPNAGIPDIRGEYGQNSEEMATEIETILKKGILHIIGGCCGTTPVYIAAIAERVKRLR